MEWLWKWWPVLSTVGNLAVLWVAWSIRQIAESRMREIAGSIAEQVQQHDRRIGRIEQELAHVPRRDDVGAMHVKLTATEGELKAIDAKLGALKEGHDAVRAAIVRIEGFLLQRGER